MDGFEFAKTIKGDPKFVNIPIIMITSRTAEKHRNRAAELGVDLYLGKPYQEEELLRHLREMTGIAAPLLARGTIRRMTTRQQTIAARKRGSTTDHLLDAPQRRVATEPRASVLTAASRTARLPDRRDRPITRRVSGFAFSDRREPRRGRGPVPAWQNDSKTTCCRRS